MSSPKQRTHPLMGDFGSTLAAAVAIGAFGSNFIRVPAKMPGGRRPIIRGIAAQGPKGRAAIGSDDLSRMEDLLGIKDRLDLTQNGKEPAILARHPWRASYAGAVLRADGATQLQSQGAR